MNIHDWLYTLPQYLVLFPSAFSCYLPTKNQMKYTWIKTAALCLVVLVPFILIASWFQSYLQIESNYFLLPALVLFFPLYRKTLKTDLQQALAVYVGVCAAQTFPAQFANIFDIYIHPLSWKTEFSLEASLLQLALACLLPLIAAYPSRHQFSWIIDYLNSPKIWYTTVCLSSVFLVFNVMAIPTSNIYSMNSTSLLFLLLETCALALLASAYTLFYQGAKLILEHAQLEQRSQLLEMQSHQYRALQDHMHQTARLRHDFRHSVRLLSALAEQGDLVGIRSHLAAYEHSLTENVAAIYCTNATLNALLGYYHEAAVSCAVETDWKIRLPEPLTVSELDLASLFGNLIENGIDGCQTLKQGKRYFNLTTEVRHGSTLYIVSINSFDGFVDKRRDQYRSTKHSGSGIGLASIAAVVEKYNGSMQISNTDTEFYVDIIINL